MIHIQIVVIGAAILVHDPVVIQTSKGDCTVNVANVGQDVSVTNNCGIDPRVVEPLVDTINRLDKSYADKVNELLSWIKRYHELEKELGSANGYIQLRKEVQVAYESGNFIEAATKQKQIIQQEEKSIQDLPEDYYKMAEMYVLQFDSEDARAYFGKAFNAARDNPKYAEAYARSLCEQGKLPDAQRVYQKSLDDLTELAATDPKKYLGDVSCTYTDLGGLYNLVGNSAAFRAASEKALNAASKLSELDPGAAQEHLADAYCGLGAADFQLNNLGLAKSELDIANRIYEEKQIENSNTPYVHEILAAIEKKDGRIDEMMKELLRALTLQENLAVKENAINKSPSKYRWNLSLNFKEVEDTYSELKDGRKAQEQFDQYMTFLTTSGFEQISRTYLIASALESNAGVLMSQDKTEQAKIELSRAVDLYSSIRDQLTDNESKTFALAEEMLRGIDSASQKP